MKVDLKKIILVAFILSGMAALIYEVVWTRPLSLIFGSTVYAVSTMLAAFMAGLALGSYLISKYTDKIKNLPSTYALLELGIGLYGVSLIFIFNYLPSIYIVLYNSFHTSFYFFSLIQFVLVFFVLMIPTTLMGATWPVVAKFYTERRVGKGIGEIYSANNLGAIIGSFSAGFILIPLLGIKYSFIFAGSVNIFVGSFILFISSRSLAKKLVPIVLIFFLTFTLSFSYNIKRLTFGSFYYSYIPKEDIENSQLLFYKDGLYGTVTVLDYKGTRSLLIDGKSEGGTSFTDKRTNYLLAYLPLLLYPNPKTSLNIGFGTGMTSGVLGKYTKTTTVEIDPAVVKASELFIDVNNDVLNYPNHRLIITDARNHFLQNKTKYDIIVSEPSSTWKSTSSILFSKEFYELVKSRLSDNGLYAQWVPIFEYNPEDFRIFYNTFHSVFPNIIAFGNIKDEIVGEYRISTTEIILVGSDDEIKLNWDEIAEKIKNSEISEDLHYIRIDNIDQLKNLFYFTDEQMKDYGKDYPIITDNNPVLEFSSARIIIERKDPTRVIDDIESFLVRVE